MIAPARSWLYVPGSRPERVAKALVAGADAVVIDLEDSVAPHDKALARDSAVRVARSRRTDAPGPQLWVRVNDPQGPWGDDDLRALDDAPLDGIRLPRAESPTLVHEVAQRTALPLQLLLETATGLMRAQELATADPRVVGIGLGEADLAADLRVPADQGLVWARGFVVAAARAAGLPSPVQSVWTAVTDEDGLRLSTLEARRTGFFGRSVVHPRQVPVVNAVFTPSTEEVADAAAVVQAFDRAQRRGESAVLDDQGRFLDPAVVDRARLVLDLHDRISERRGDVGQMPASSPPSPQQEAE